jgi:5-methylcytosine-specific restriction endonuclease McrA
MPRSKGRTGHRWRQISEQVLRSSDTCYLCGHRVYRHLPRGHPAKATVDHVQPLSRDGAELDPQNLRVACSRCNNRKGNRAALPYIPTSRRW